MALELEYRNTFIDVKEDFQVLASRKRAHSSPPGRARCSSFATEMNDEEAAIRSYVGGLAQNAWPQSGQISSNLAEHLSPSPVSVNGVPDLMMHEQMHVDVLSVGSWGHPDVCRRPCIYFMSGHCENGEACAYCHLPHTEKMAKLDKRQRAMVQQLTRPELLSMVFPFCSRKAEDGGFADKAEEILGLLEMELDPATSSSQLLADRELRNLRKTLARMSFSSLIGLVIHRSPDQDEDPALQAALESLRSKLRGHGQAQL
ncbi:unnamed protein product [Symbiodinium sp. KB8]|nr:unnamed protein product [Symbiodinium sp. KB8]